MTIPAFTRHDGEAAAAGWMQYPVDQLPIVIPAYDIVMVFTASNILDGPGPRHREAIDRVLAAVTDGKPQ